MTGLRFIGAWAAISIIGETCAVFLASIAAETTFAAVAVVVLLEALILGAGQARLLRVRGETGLHWTAATIAGTGAGRFVEFATAIANGGNDLAWTPALHYLAGAELGCLVGACMAVPQVFVLRDRFDPSWWVCARAAAWASAIPLLMSGGGAIARWTNAAPLTLVCASLALFAVVAALVGIMEGFVMDRLLARRRAEPSAIAVTSRA